MRATFARSIPRFTMATRKFLSRVIGQSHTRTGVGPRLVRNRPKGNVISRIRKGKLDSSSTHFISKNILLILVSYLCFIFGSHILVSVVRSLYSSISNSYCIYRFHQTDVSRFFLLLKRSSVYGIAPFDHKREDVPLLSRFRFHGRGARPRETSVTFLVFAKTISRGIRDWERGKWNSSRVSYPRRSYQTMGIRAMIFADVRERYVHTRTIRKRTEKYTCVNDRALCV